MSKIELTDVWAYIRSAVQYNHLLKIVITSQAEASQRGDGWDTGQGKSTLAMYLMIRILRELCGYNDAMIYNYITPPYY